MKSTVAATLKDAFDYCQATFNLTPLGIQVPKRDVSNNQISADGTIPYCILDELRSQHAIDVSGLQVSRTQKGNLYRSHVLSRSYC